LFSFGTTYNRKYCYLEKVYPLDVGEAVTLDGVTIEGLKAVHGPLIVKFFGLKLLNEKPGPGERIGLGAIGFKINIDDKVIVNINNYTPQLCCG
jgi:hypothetical protein